LCFDRTPTAQNTMTSYPDPRSKSRRPFITTAYHPDAQGVLQPEIPARCPYSTAGEETPCEVSFHHVRVRKTGPCYGLVVMTCLSHGRGFTLYPPGFGPYQRSAVVQLGPDGGPIMAREGEERGGGDSPDDSGLRRDFRDTFFQSALDAAQGIPWSRESLSEAPDQWFSTQWRHLRLSADLLGVAPDMDDSQRAVIASVLETDMLRLREGAQEIRDRRGYVTRGRVVRRVLLSLRGGVRRALRLLFCGHVIGQWGRPAFWDEARRSLIMLPFPPPGTP
jgi:hypothetical protein